MTSADYEAELYPRFEYSEASERERDISGLVMAQISALENMPDRQYHLRLTLSCGSTFLDGADAQYKVSMRQCAVYIEALECSVDLSDAYCYQLPDDDASESASANISRKSGSNRSLEMDLSGNINVRDQISSALKGKFSTSKADNLSQDKTYKNKRRIMLISFNGGSWLVGDEEHGDPRNAGGLLRERYFNEDATKPLCAVKIKEGSSASKVTLQVRARFGYLDVDVLNSLGRPKRKIETSDVGDVTVALKSKLEGIAIAKAIREQQKQVWPTLPPSEFILAERSIVAHVPKPVAKKIKIKRS